MRLTGTARLIPGMLRQAVVAEGTHRPLADGPERGDLTPVQVARLDTGAASPPQSRLLAGIDLFETIVPYEDPRPLLRGASS